MTVAPAAIAPRSVARTVGDVVADQLGGARHDEVVLAVHDVLTDVVTRDPSDPFTVRVRRRDDDVVVEVVGRDHRTSAPPGPLHVAHACSDGVDVEATDAGHLIRLRYRSP